MHKWESLYNAAVLETDLAKRRQLVGEAEQSMRQYLTEESVPEDAREKCLRCLDALDALKTELH